MECFWRLHRNRRPVRYFNQQDPPIFHLYIYPYNGLAGHYLYGTGFLEKHEKIYLGRQKKSLVLSIKNKGRKFLQPFLISKNKNIYWIVSSRIAPFFAFAPYFLSASFPSTKVMRNGPFNFS
jgi:hypothetical protein